MRPDKPRDNAHTTADNVHSKISIESVIKNKEQCKHEIILQLQHSKIKQNLQLKISSSAKHMH